VQIEPNLIIVSDHGMAPVSIDRVIILDDYIDRSSVQIDSDGSAVGLRPLRGDVASLVRVFEKVPHLKAYRAEDLPPHLKLKNNPRISPVWLLAEEGWQVVTRATFDRYKVRFSEKGFLQGDHGYDPQIPSMRGILIAQGPAFRRGETIAETENVHVYNLMCAVLGITPAKNDGDDRLVKTMLRK
jgi:predicted AlkP superfamily pyrophosphatase or phosphodiesterase